MNSLAVVVAALALTPSAELKLKQFDWPQFRGPNRDGFSAETGLLKEWPKEGPKKLYTTKGLGGGFSTVSVAGGYVFGTGKQKDGKEYAWALDDETGTQKWATAFAEGRKVGYDEGTRSTPTYADGKIFVVSMDGTIAALEAETGKILWSKNYVKDFGGSVQAWGFSESVLVDDGKVICAPGSKTAAVVALDAKTGDVIWKTAVEKPGGAGGYASAVKAEVGGVPMYVTLLGNSGGVVGVQAKTGKLLWHYTRMMNGTANIPNPGVKGDLVFASTGYGAGSALLQLVPGNDGIEAKEIKFYKGNELQNHHGGMVPVGDYIYLGNQHGSGFPACVEIKTGEIKWKEPKAVGGGGGSAATAAADGMVYFRYENGVIALIKADPNEFHLVSSFKIPEPSGKPSWPHPTIANGKLYIRDQDKLHVFSLKK